MSRSSLKSSRQFWEEKATENPYWYVSSYGPYDNRNLDEFWKSGETIWRQIQDLTGYSPQSNHQVVEIGCGVGRLTRIISPRVKYVYAFDISEQMIEMAKQRHLPNVGFFRTDTNLGVVPDATVDLALAYCVFQHLPSSEVLHNYINEMQRVTKKGGIVAFTLTPRAIADNLRPLMKLKAKMMERLRRNGPRNLGTDEWLGIRPSTQQVLRMGKFQHTAMGAERELYWCIKPQSSPQH